MSVSVEFDAADTMARIQRVRDRLRERRPQLLRAWGRELLDRAHRDFDAKSAGGQGSDGSSWKPLLPATVRRKGGSTRIGVRSGELEQPAGDLIRLNRSSVTAGFGDAHAEYFDEQRPLLPERMPDAWYQHLAQMALEWGLDVVKDLQ